MSIIIKKNIVLERKHQKPILADVYANIAKESKPVVLFCHGYKGFKDWGCWHLAAEAFAKAGFCFVKFNFSHNGGTIEEPMDFPDLEAFGNNNFTKELDDLESVIDWVTSSDFKDVTDINTNDITLIGHSRGGGIVAIKAGEDNRVTRIISWAGVSDLSRMLGKEEDFSKWKEDGVRYIINGRTKQKMPHYYQFLEDFRANEERLTVKNSVKKLNIPYGIIHGNADTSVEITAGEDLYKWSPNSDFIIIEGANHVFGGKHPWYANEMPEHLDEVVHKSINFIVQDS